MAPTDKESHDLARDYGLDITMPEVNLAVSSAAQKEYQKKCNFLYKEFQKNMTYLIKDENKVRQELRTLKKELVTNSRYSLYRSSGADLFSKATQKRKKFMDNNLATVSPLFEDTCFVYSPNESTVNDDTVRPQTAPTESKHQEPQSKVTSSNELRPQTAAVSNIVKDSDNNSITRGSPVHNQGCRNTDQPDCFLKPSHRVSPLHPGGKMTEQIDRLLNAATQHISGGSVFSESPMCHNETDIPVMDGEVDPQTERTRARKITINATKFAELQKGKTFVTLKDKDGEFILKPINLNYEPNEVEAVFFAKDPTKEKMALVRQNTTWESNTVSSDLKVNNRIAIQKSLMGLKAKKTTVAEIFNNARDRRTRHFRIMLKNPVVQNKGKEHAQKFQRRKSEALEMYKQNQQQHQSQNQSSYENQISKPKLPVKQSKNTGPPSPKPPILRDTSTPATGTYKSKKVVLNAWNGNNTSLKNEKHGDISNLPPKVKFERMFGEHLDVRSQTPINRCTSSMSMRDVSQYTMSDKDMTEMFRRMVEGRGDGGVDEDKHTLKPFPTTQRKKQAVPSDTVSNAGTSLSIEPQRRVLRYDPRSIIRDERRRDMEYSDAMQRMRRRVTLGAGMRRPNSVASFR